MTTEDWKKQLPMWITYSRIAVTPIVLLALLPQNLFWNVIASLVFVIASVTDYYDGYFARKYQATSNLGKFMDPIADKILVSSIIVFLAVFKKIDPWLVVIIMARDTYISGIRAVAAADNLIIAAKPAGKWKTALQMGAIPAVIIGESQNFFPYLHKIGYIILWVSVILSITSGIEYYRAYKQANKS